MKNAIVTGGLNFDICGVPDGELRAHDSNIGRVIMRTGGVGHNIAARLAELDVPVELVTVIGSDAIAYLLSATCAEEKIGLNHVVRLNGSSCYYLSIHEKNGDMAAAINAMKLMDAFTPERLPMDAINAAALCVVDANLPAATLEALAARAKTPLLVDPVSCAKADRVRAMLPRLEAIKPNLMEARYLSGETDPARAAARLIEAGVKRTFISMGSEGVYFAGNGEAGLVPAPKLSVRNTTGAGDAMAAGIARALMDGASTRRCAEEGVANATKYLRGTNP